MSYIISSDIWSLGKLQEWRGIKRGFWGDEFDMGVGKLRNRGHEQLSWSLYGTGGFDCTSSVVILKNDEMDLFGGAWGMRLWDYVCQGFEQDDILYHAPWLDWRMDLILGSQTDDLLPCFHFTLWVLWYEYMWVPNTPYSGLACSISRHIVWKTNLG